MRQTDPGSRDGHRQEKKSERSREEQSLKQSPPATPRLPLCRHRHTRPPRGLPHPAADTKAPRRHLSSPTHARTRTPPPASPPHPAPNVPLHPPRGLPLPLPHPRRPPRRHAPHLPLLQHHPHPRRKTSKTLQRPSGLPSHWPAHKQPPQFRSLLEHSRPRPRRDPDR